MPKPNLIVIAGATAVGKTALCVRLAQALGTPIISADSRQLFKEMSIGTAKPTTNEMQDVKHYFVDSHSIHQPYNVRKYEQECLHILDSLFKTNIQTVILTGGSGMYIDAICQGLNDMPDINPKVRTDLEDALEQRGLSPLLEKLKQLDPSYYEQVDKANHRRVLRALEVCLSSGQTFSSFRSQAYTARNFTITKVLLVRERQELYDRINLRMDIMLKNGLLQEAKALYPYKHYRALQTVGYQEIFDFLDNTYDWEECVRLLKRNSRRYAKRQITWFGKDKDYHHFHPNDEQQILAFLKSSINKKAE